MKVRSPYDKNIALILNIKLDYFYSIIDKMNNEDWQYLYFYSGRYIGKQNDSDMKKLKAIISKYQRIEKINNIIDDEN
jgi:hypothetical protein